MSTDRHVMNNPFASEGSIINNNTNFLFQLTLPRRLENIVFNHIKYLDLIKNKLKNSAQVESQIEHVHIFNFVEI